MTHQPYSEAKKSFLGNLTTQIILAMILGAILGVSIFHSGDVAFAKSFSGNIKILATIFIRLVQMIIDGKICMSVPEQSILRE